MQGRFNTISVLKQYPSGSIPDYAVHPYLLAGMSKRFFLLAFFLSCLPQVFLAQSAAVKVLLRQVSHSATHRENRDMLSHYLSFNNPDKNDQLYLKEAIVKEMQELQLWDSCLQYCRQEVADGRDEGNTLKEAIFLKLTGNTYYHIIDKEKAVQYWEKARIISEQYGFKTLQRQLLGNIAAYYIDKHSHIELAEQYLREAVQLPDATNEQESVAVYRAYRLLATLYERTKQFGKSEAIYKRLIEQNQLSKDSVHLSESKMFYALMLGGMKNYPKALQHVNEAILLAEKMKHLDLLQTGLQIYADLLYQSGDYRNAWEVKNRLQLETQQRFSTDLNQKISEAEARFKNAETEHEKELVILKAKKKNQLLIYGFISLFLIMSLLLYQFYQRRHIRQKMQIQTQVQEEKERLSRDLHDNLGSQLTLLSNNIESLDNRLLHGGPVTDNMERVKDSARGLLQTLRETIWVLNRDQVTEEEFFDKLVDYVHRYVQQFGSMQLNITETFERKSVLQSGEALQLFRICQEAIQNACRHSGSDIIFISCSAKKDGFKLQIRDKGAGFNPQLAGRNGHYGLTNMQERAIAIGAEFAVISSPGEGCLVEISRP